MYAKELAEESSSAACHRCITPGGAHYISATANCLGKGKVESLLGYVSIGKSSNTPRALRLCGDKATGELIHAVDENCEKVQPGLTQLEFLGFVH